MGNYFTVGYKMRSFFFTVVVLLDDLEINGRCCPVVCSYAAVNHAFRAVQCLSWLPSSMYDRCQPQLGRTSRNAFYMTAIVLVCD